MSEALYSQLQNTIIPAMATPLDISGYKISARDVEPLVNFLIERAVGGLFVGGTTGEGVLLSLAERKRLHELTMTATAGRVPVLLHVGTNTTRESFELAMHAESLGADAIVVVTPYFYPLRDEDLFNYFKTVAEAAPKTPFLAYDIPHFANNGITAALVGRLSAEIPTFAGLKCSRPDLQIIRQLRAAIPDGKLFLAGNERILIGSLAIGAHGAISGLATAVPEPFVALINAFSSGKIETARRWHQLINQLLDVTSPYPRIGGIKAILNSRKIFVGDPVPPRPAVKTDLWTQLLAVIENFSQT